jgi:hypothetical protein
MNRQDARDAKGEPKNSDDFLFANLALLASWRFSPLFAFFSSLLIRCRPRAAGVIGGGSSEPATGGWVCGCDGSCLLSGPSTGRGYAATRLRGYAATRLRGYASVGGRAQVARAGSLVEDKTAFAYFDDWSIMNSSLFHLI